MDLNETSDLHGKLFANNFPFWPWIVNITVCQPGGAEPLGTPMS